MPSTPDARRHNPDPQYLRGLIDRIGQSQIAVAERLGVSARTLRKYLAEPCAPYTAQFCLEQWADAADFEDLPAPPPVKARQAPGP